MSVNIAVINAELAVNSLCLHVCLRACSGWCRVCGSAFPPCLVFTLEACTCSLIFICSMSLSDCGNSAEKSGGYWVFSNSTVVLKMKSVFLAGAVLAAVGDRPLSKYPLPLLPCASLTGTLSPCHAGP